MRHPHFRHRGLLLIPERLVLLLPVGLLGARSLLFGYSTSGTDLPEGQQAVNHTKRRPCQATPSAWVRRCSKPPGRIPEIVPGSRASKGKMFQPPPTTSTGLHSPFHGGRAGPFEKNGRCPPYPRAKRGWNGGGGAEVPHKGLGVCTIGSDLGTLGVEGAGCHRCCHKDFRLCTNETDMGTPGGI